MTWWEWVADFQRRASEARDAERMRLASLLHRAYGLRERDPGRFLALCADGRRLAQRLREPWWTLGFRAAVVQELVHFARDFRRAPEEAVAAVLEARKPQYDGCPLRTLLYLDLIAVHFCTDPDGCAGSIEESFCAVERDADKDLSSRLHVLNLRRWCAEQARRADDHYGAAQRVLAAIAENPGDGAAVHYSTFVYNALCHVNYAHAEWQELREAAGLAEEASRRMGNRVELSQACLWQAVAAFRSGDSLRARRLQRQGSRIVEELGIPPPDGLFTALSLCHEQTGQLEEALAVRNRELELVHRQGRTISEVYCHRQRCRLLADLGRLSAADLDAARAAALRLRFPAPHLAELNRQTDGEPPAT